MAIVAYHEIFFQHLTNCGNPIMPDCSAVSSRSETFSFKSDYSRMSFGKSCRQDEAFNEYSGALLYIGKD
jgi:hypothetical protein